MIKNVIDEARELPARVEGSGGTARFLESPNDPWRSGYRVLSPDDFEAMKPSLVVDQDSPFSQEPCLGCELEATLTDADKG